MNKLSLKKGFVLLTIELLLVGGFFVATAVPAQAVAPTWNTTGSYVVALASTGPDLREIPGCGDNTSGFSVTTGESCANNIPRGRQVLGAEHFYFTLLLKKGSHGNEVTELQKFLNGAGYHIGTPDGKFDNKTKASVIKFQLANGLKGDGIVGALARAILNK